MLHDIVVEKTKLELASLSPCCKPKLSKDDKVRKIMRRHDFMRYYLSRRSLCSDESRIVRQFLEALFFEQAIEYETYARKSLSIDDVSVNRVYSEIIVFSLSGLECLCLGAKKSFDRIRIADGSVRYSDKGRYCEMSLNKMLEFLPAEDECRNRLLQELGQTLELCRWNRTHLDEPFGIRRNKSYTALESCIHEGHLYHPCFKTRTGFSLLDHERYGPESGRRFQLNWLAIRKSYLRVSLPNQHKEFWKKEIGERVYCLLEEKLLQLGGSWGEYDLTPIHPWQFKNLLEKGLNIALRKGEIINLGEEGDFYQAGQSLRTLFNVTNPNKANIKLPLNIISTSSHRNLQEHFVCSAPAMSSWLNNIVKNDEFLKNTNHVHLLLEYAGMNYELEPSRGEDHTKSSNIHISPLVGKIGAIFRESVTSKLVPGEEAVPFSSLMLVESDRQPFISPWIKQYGIEAWLNQLIDVVVIPIWHLLVHYGVAFESHGQNLVLIHREGFPEKIAMRDFHEETEYMPQFLPDCLSQPDLESVDDFFSTIPDDDGHRVSSIESLRDMFTDTICVFNLSELSFLLERFYDYREEKFWQTVSKKIRKYNMSGVTDAQRISKVNADCSSLKVESLLTKKIRNGGTLDFYFHSVSNELKF